MRSYGMYDASRGLTLALAAALAGLAALGRERKSERRRQDVSGSRWRSSPARGSCSRWRTIVGTWTKGLRLRISPSTFVLAFLPVLVCVGWILLATQPGSGWQEGRLDHWSNSIGILGLVKSIGLWHGVLAFGFGLVLGLCFDGVPAPPVEEARRTPARHPTRLARRPTSPSAQSVAGRRHGAGRRRQRRLKRRRLPPSRLARGGECRPVEGTGRFAAASLDGSRRPRIPAGRDHAKGVGPPI